MHKKRFLCLILALCLVMLGATCWIFSVQQREVGSLRFTVRGMDLSLYHDEENGKYCLFLPAFASPEALSAAHSGIGTVRFSSGGQVFDSIGQVPMDQDVTMTVAFPFGIEDQYVFYMSQCSARQTIHIRTQSGTMERVDSDQDDELSVAVTIFDRQGQAQYQGQAAISGRGNATWQWPKKPYTLTFPGPINAAGFENLSKLCLLAEYVDQSKLRNALAYHTGKALDIAYASGYVYADVYIDGVYNGIYGVTTKEEYTKYIADDGIEAVFELSSSYKGDYFFTDFKTPIRVYYGTVDRILSNIEDFEISLKNRDWDTFWKTADITSWARKYALDEFFYNFDLPGGSQYFYLDGDNIIKCMLPWDYELTFYARMAPYEFTQERALAAYYDTGNWYEILLENEEFRQEVARVLREEFTDSFFQSLDTYLDGCVQELTGSWHCDRYRWYPDYAADPMTDGGRDAMEQAANSFHTYFDHRRDFLLPLMENWEDYCRVMFFQDVDGTLTQISFLLIVPAGTDLGEYREQILETLTYYGPQSPVSVTSQDGVALEDIGMITENLTFTTVY